MLVTCAGNVSCAVFKKELEKDLSGDLSGYFRRLMISLCTVSVDVITSALSNINALIVAVWCDDYDKHIAVAACHMATIESADILSPVS